jgi:hypothetical protein
VRLAQRESSPEAKGVCGLVFCWATLIIRSQSVLEPIVVTTSI